MKQILPLKTFAAILLSALFFISLTAKAKSSTTDTEAPRGTVKGKVSTQDHKPAENVSVNLKGTKYGTVTDEDGEFHFRAPAGNYILVISYVGYKTFETAITVKAGQVANIADITIQNNENSLSTVNILGTKTNKFARKNSEIVAKMPLTNLENPQVYTTINKDLLTEQQLFSADDAIKNAPGIQTMWQATGRGGDGGAYYNSRGFILQSTFRDGVAGVVTNTNDAANIEKIEVIKGPSATLFGSTLTSFGGLINRVTKKPYDHFGGEVSYSAGSYGLSRLSADVNTPLDSAKKLLFRLNTAFTYQGSFQYQGFSRNGIVAPSLSYQVNDRLSILVNAELSYGKGSGKPIFFFPGSNVSSLGTNLADGLALDYKQTYFNSDLTQNSQSTNYFAQVNYKISDHWTSRTNFTSSGSYSNGFGTYYYLLAKDTISRNDQSTKNSRDRITEVQQNFNGDFKIGGLRNRFVGGLDWMHDNSNQFFFGSGFDKVATTLGHDAYNNYNYANMSAIYNSGTIDFTYPIIFKSNTYSAYAADVLNLTDQLMVMAALRVDRYENKGSFDINGNPTAPAYKQTAWSPKFGVIFQPVKDQVSLFVNYQNGFINPSPYTAFDNASNSIITKIPELQQANQIEGGVKLDLFEGKLSSTVSYYDIKLTNVLRSDPAHAAQYAQLQDGTQLSKGFEAEVIANPVPGLNIIGGFSYNDSKYTKADADVEGRRPATASAPYSANFYVSYRLQQMPLKGLGFGFGGNYVSDNKIINSISEGEFILPAYTILNASAFYERSRYRFNLGVNNLGNQKYWIGYTTVNPQMLRQVVASATFKF
ncbi:MAG TPA: TonB-dependent receptor [Mucilaginibacter sp.]|nr:TonB-dependent receptor [Mucilaginibacter sp.]